MIRNAAATDRMGSDEDFAEFVYDEMAIGLTSDLAKLTSYDRAVSLKTDIVDASGAI